MSDSTALLAFEQLSALTRLVNFTTSPTGTTEDETMTTLLEACRELCDCIAASNAEAEPLCVICGKHGTEHADDCAFVAAIAAIAAIKCQEA